MASKQKLAFSFMSSEDGKSNEVPIAGKEQLLELARKLKTPKPERIRGSCRFVFNLLCAGTFFRYETREALEGKVTSYSLRKAISRLKRYGLICEGEFRLVHLSPLGGLYRDLFSGVGRNISLPLPSEDLTIVLFQNLMEIVRGPIQKQSNQVPHWYKT